MRDAASAVILPLLIESCFWAGAATDPRAKRAALRADFFPARPIQPRVTHWGRRTSAVVSQCVAARGYCRRPGAGLDAGWSPVIPATPQHGIAVVS